MFDTSTDVGKTAKGRLEDESIAWLTTVRRDGMPQPIPVWFLWAGEAFLIYSHPEARKIKNIRQNPHVAVNLNSDAVGRNIVRAVGGAEIVEDASPLTEIPAYIEKYRSSIPALGMSEDEVAEVFSAAIRIRPERWQIW